MSKVTGFSGSLEIKGGSPLNIKFLSIRKQEEHATHNSLIGSQQKAAILQYYKKKSTGINHEFEDNEWQIL